MLVQEARTQWEKFDAVVAGVKSMLDYVDLEVAPQPVGKPPCSDTIIQRCKALWESFKSFSRDAVVYAITHALAVVRSHYQSVDLQDIGDGFTEGLSEVETQQLEDEVEDAVKKLAGDIDMFGETSDDGEAR